MTPWRDTLIPVGIFLAVLGLIYWMVARISASKGEPMDWKSFGRLVEQFAPIALAVAGVPPILVPVVVHGIQVAETFGGSGPEKKAQAIDLVTTAILGTNIAAGKQVVDPLAIHAVSNGIDTVVGVVNLVKKQPIAPDADLLIPPPPNP